MVCQIQFAENRNSTIFQKRFSKEFPTRMYVFKLKRRKVSREDYNAASYYVLLKTADF